MKSIGKAAVRIVSFLLLFIALRPLAQANPVTFDNHVTKAATAFYQGKSELLATHGREAFRHADDVPILARLEVADHLASMCLRAYRIDCALEFGKIFDEYFVELQETEETREFKYWHFIKGTTRIIKVASQLGNYELADKLAEALSKSIGRYPSTDTRAFIDAHLALAYWKIRKKQYDGAQLHIQAAWVHFLSLKDPSDATILEYTPSFIGLLELAGYTKRAINLSGIAVSYFASRGGMSGYDLLRGAVALHSINVKSNNHQAAILSASTVVTLASNLDLPNHTKSFLSHSAKALFVIDCVLFTHPECEKSPAFVKELDEALKEKKLIDWYSPEDKGGLAIAVSLYSLSKSRKSQPHIKSALKEAAKSAEQTENSIKNIALYLAARESDDQENAKKYIRLATLEQIEKIKGEKKRTLIEITPINNYQRIIFALFTDTVFSQVSRSQEDQSIIFELADLGNQSARNVESEYLRLTSQLSNRSEIAALQSYHRLIQDMTLTESRIFNAQIQRRLRNDPQSEKEEKNFALITRFQGHYDDLSRLQPTIEKARVRYQINSDGLLEVQKILTKEERFITHQLVGRSLVTVCAAPSKVWVEPASVDFEKLGVSIKLVQASLSNPSPPADYIDSQFPIESSLYLTKILLSPVAECVEDAKHLITSFNPVFSGIPPHVLFSPKDLTRESDLVTSSIQKLPWLGIEYGLSVVPSISQLIATRKSRDRSPATRAFIGFGDPKLTGLTSDGHSRGKAVMRGVNQKISRQLGELEELPETATELKSFSEKFGPSSKILLKEDATEAAVRREVLRDFKVLAFATHGLIKEEIEGLSEPALVLTPIDSSVSVNDGVLTATDISRLDLSAQLVILSACNSGKFDIPLFSAEVGGLSTAFFLGGAKATIASLWSVNSDATSYLMQNFSSQFSGGSVAASEALRRAIAGMVHPSSNGVVFAHPRYWAAFSVFGDGATLLERDSPHGHFFVKNIEAFSEQPGHIQEAVKVKEGFILTGATPNTSKDTYDGYIKIVDENGKTAAKVRDPERFFKLLGEQVDGRVAAVVQPTNYDAEGVFELRLYSEKLSLLEAWTFGRVKGEVSISLLRLKKSNELILLSNNLNRSTDHTILIVRILDLKNKRVRKIREIHLRGNHHHGVKLVEYQDGSLKLLANHYGSSEGLTDFRSFLPPSFFGVAHFCYMRYFTSAHSLSADLEDIGAPVTYPDIAVRTFIHAIGKDPMVLLTEYEVCSTNERGTVLASLEERSIEVVKRFLLNGIDSFPDKLVKTPRGYVMAGGAKRRFEDGNLDQWNILAGTVEIDPLKGKDMQTQTGAFFAKLDENFEVVDQDVLFGSLDIFVESAVLGKEDLFLFGNSGDRQFGGRLSLAH